MMSKLTTAFLLSATPLLSFPIGTDEAAALSPKTSRVFRGERERGAMGGYANAWGSSKESDKENTYTKIAPLLQKKERGGDKHRKGSQESVSTNWSGYVATSSKGSLAGQVTGVSGTWIVPSLAPSETNGYSSAWVGIDGFGSPTVEQLGTEHDWVNGSQHNYAWFEMYPQGSYQLVGFPVDAGDQITASVDYQGRGRFILTMKNDTKKLSTTVPFYRTASRKAERASAEWVVESPSTSGGVLPLANYVMTTFSNCTASFNNVTGPINDSEWANEMIIMENSTGQVISLPSPLRAEGHSFTVAYQ